MGDYYLSTGIYELPNDLGLRIKSSPKKKKIPVAFWLLGALMPTQEKKDLGLKIDLEIRKHQECV